MHWHVNQSRVLQYMETPTRASSGSAADDDNCDFEDTEGIVSDCQMSGQDADQEGGPGQEALGVGDGAELVDTEGNGAVVQGAEDTNTGFMDLAQYLGLPQIEADEEMESEVSPVNSGLLNALEDEQAMYEQALMGITGNKRGTVANYMTLLNHPVFSKEQIPQDWEAPNIGTMVLNLLALKQLSGMHSSGMDMLVHLLHKCMLPPGNLLPPSYHFLKNIAKVESPGQFEWHQCVCRETCWEPLEDKKQWKVVEANQASAVETPHLVCSHCLTARFRLVKKKFVEPAGWSYYEIGIKHGIELLFQSKNFIAAFATDMEDTPYFKSREYARQQGYYATKGLRSVEPLNGPGNVLIEFGHDGMTPFDSNRKHTTWVVWIRVKNMEPVAYTQKISQIPVLILPGQAGLESALDNIVDELDKYQPGKDPLIFRDVEGNWRNVHVVLAGVLGDFPARSKITHAGEHTSYFPCMWCTFSGTQVRKTVPNAMEVGQSSKAKKRRRDKGKGISKPRGRGRASTTTKSRGRQSRQSLYVDQAGPSNASPDESDEDWDQLPDGSWVLYASRTSRARGRSRGKGRARGNSGHQGQRSPQLTVEPQTTAPNMPQQQLQVNEEAGAAQQPQELTRSTLRYLGYASPVLQDRFFLYTQEQQLRGKSTWSDLSRMEKTQEQTREQLADHEGLFFKSHVFQRELLVGDSDLMLSDQQQLQRQHLVRKYEHLAPILGVKGFDRFSWRLPYTSFNNLYVLPVFHQLLRGVLRDFWEAALGPNSVFLTHTAKSQIKERSNGLTITDDFNRAYKDITQYMSSWRMADFLAWADAISAVILHGMQIGLPPKSDGDHDDRELVTTAVHGMHEAVAFFCRATTLTGGEYTIALQKHHQQLVAYAKMVEVKTNGDLCKANLHLTICRLARQCRERGHSGNENETQLERGVQWLKQPIRYRVVDKPERAMCQSALYQFQLSSFQQTFAIPNYDQLLPDYNRYVSTDMDMGRARNLTEDEVNARSTLQAMLEQYNSHADSVVMSGQPIARGVAQDELIRLRGYLVNDIGNQSAPQRRKLANGAVRYVRRTYDWNQVQRNQVFCYRQIKLHDQRTLSSYESRGFTSESFWCLVMWTEPGQHEAQLAVTRVEYYFVVGVPEAAYRMNGTPRFAKVTYFATRDLLKAGESKREVYEADIRQADPRHGGCSVAEVSTIAHKVMKFEDMSVRSEDERWRKALFVPYANTSNI